MPAWRSASPKKWNTRPLKMSPKDWPQKRMMSPPLAIQSRGTDSQPMPVEVERVAGLAATSRPIPRSSRLFALAKDGCHLITRISGWVASSVCVNT